MALTATSDALSQTATAMIGHITETAIAPQTDPINTPDALSQTATARVQQITATVQVQQTATAAANREACPIPSGWTTYQIRSGDTFLRLASDYAVTVEQIASANCFDRNTPPLEPGQVIYVPATVSTPTAISPEMAQTAMAQQNTAPVRAEGLSVAGETTVYATAQDFENGLMIYRSDTGTIYVLLDNGDARIYEAQTYGEWPLNTDEIAPDGYQPAINGFGQIWMHEDNLRESLGGATGREVGWQMRVTTYENGTVDLYQLNGSMYRVQGDSWTQFP
jgi:LysM repeat protein